MDGLIGRMDPLPIFFVNGLRTIFLKSIDTSKFTKNDENVVKVVMDNALTYVKAGKILMTKRKQLFWTPCASHCLDLILTYIGDLPIHNDTMSKERKITVFIYMHFRC